MDHVNGPTHHIDQQANRPPCHWTTISIDHRSNTKLNEHCTSKRVKNSGPNLTKSGTDMNILFETYFPNSSHMQIERILNSNKVTCASTHTRTQVHALTWLSLCMCVRTCVCAFMKACDAFVIILVYNMHGGLMMG